ncbi:MAG: TlpA disulfide reductase family protein [bacterium]|nr:TlpA disulfide reductase family protein [bacterium]MDE0667498.1 TlpA disulfide reductase family protein [bacterium]MYB25570.1 TlpA family protein disulfide reductase [Acidimicrobiia bacterium]
MKLRAKLRRRLRGASAMLALLLALSCGSGAAETASLPPPNEGAETVNEASAAADEGTGAGEAAAADQRQVPEVRFTYFDGAEGTLADLAGKPAVINFWASWCPPCITEMPAFEAVHVELAPQVAFLGFNVGDEVGAAQDLADRTGVTYPLAADSDSAIFGAFGGFGMPTTAFVTPDGAIAHIVSSRLRAQDLRALIAEHLGI